jgi:PKD repeat protein
VNTKRILIRICLLGAVALGIQWMVLPAAGQSSFVVTNTSNSGPGTLRDAINNATTGGVITFATNLSGATITLASTLMLTNSLTIDASALTNGIQINGNGAVQIFNVASNTTVVVNSLTVTNGYTQGNGAGITNAGTLTLNQCTLSENSAPFGGGGGIWNVGTATLNQCTLSGNSGPYGGGGIYNLGTLTLNNCALSGNTSIEGIGGGIDNYEGTLTVNQCTVAGNSAGNGGGIFNGGTLTVSQCTFSGNSAMYSYDDSYGGGIFNGGTLTVNQCTVSENSAAQGGGGIYNGFSCTLMITNSIVAGNNSGSGADIYNGYLFNHYEGNFIVGLGTLGGSNIIQNIYDPALGISGTPPIASSPNLAPPGNYGGPTQTMPPLPGSPAIGTGSVAANTFTTDQRGYPRTQNGLIDIGAVELPTVQFTANPTNSNVPATVEFGSPNVDSDGTSITQWNWNYGDGNTSAGQYQTYIYTAAGTYLPSLIVTNSLGLALAATGPAITVTTPPAGTGMIMTVYDDSLENGWQDYGFATDNYTNHSPVHSGTNSISVTINSPYYGIQIHHADFTNTPYANISFWLNGGPTGGQQLQVYGVLDGVNQTPRFYLSPPTANTWQEYVVPLSALGVADATNFSAFVIQDYAGMAEPTFYLDDIQLNSPFVVLNTNDSGAYSLRNVIAIAPSGSTITFDSGLSGQTILLASTLMLTNSLTIDASALPGGIQINGNGQIFNVASNITVVLNSLTITNGNADSSSGTGGGIYNDGTLTVNQCTLSGNVGDSSGGGIYNDGTLTVNQCTLSGNSSIADGGGIYNDVGRKLTVNQCTLSGNSSGDSGGGIANYGMLMITNSIVAGNTGGFFFGFPAEDDIYNNNSSTLIYGGANIVQFIYNGGTTNGPAPITNAPLLAPLGNYGGPTQTMPPLPGSPAIGTGSVAANTFTTDQRGYPRTQNGLIDIGAVELPTIQFTANPTNAPVNLSVQFNGPSVDSDGSPITRWNWHFGDGTTTTNQNPIHAYLTVGSFSPNLVVTNNLGLTLSNAGPTITTFYPTVQFTATPTNGTAHLGVQFNGPGVDSGGDAIIYWNWNFGDGSASTLQNPIHVYTAGGQFYPTLTVTNNLGISIYTYGPVITVAAYSGLVLNGGFETGDFTGWMLSGGTNNTYVDDSTLSGVFPHSGNYEAILGASPNPPIGYLFQTLATTAGGNYLLSFWVNNSAGGNFLFVSWNGTNVFGPFLPPTSPFLPPELQWTNIQLAVIATGTSTVLQFEFNINEIIALDDVSVARPPVPAIAGISLSGNNLVFNGADGFSGITYYVLTSTNLALPRSQWTRVATNVLGANGSFSLTVTNAVNPSVPKQFYLLEIQ